MTERKPIILGRRTGVAGTSTAWEVRHLGRIHTVDRAWLKRGLMSGRLSGIEQVRRTDGDWGPLYGRPIYREVFTDRGLEPLDHARERGATVITTHTRRMQIGLSGALVLLVAGLPFWSPLWWTQLCLLGAAVFAVVAGLSRLLAAMATHALDTMEERLVPPVTPPPPLIDWAQKAAEDEVDALLARTHEEYESPRNP